MTRRAVVLAGGRGSRLAPYTTVLPKPLMPVGDRPILEILLRQLGAAGLDDITLAVGHLAHLVRAVVGDGAAHGVTVRYHEEECALGTAGPLASIAGLDDTFLLINGDVLTTLDFRALIGAHREAGNELTIATHRRTVRTDYGVLHTDGAVGATHRVTGYDEKPELSYTVSMGVYVLEPAAVGRLRPGERCDFPDLVLELLAQRRRRRLVCLRRLLAGHRARGRLPPRPGRGRRRAAGGRAMTRVLMLGPVNHPHVEHLALAMHERGLEVVAAGDTEPSLPASVLPDAGIAVRPAPPALRRTAAGAAAHVRWIRQLDRELRPDVVHAHWMCGYAAFAALAGASPLVAMAWGSDVLRANRLRTFASRIAVRRSRVAMADSQALLDRLVELGARREETVLVNWGVDLDAFAPVNGGRPGLRERLGLGPGPVVLSPRSLTPVYNPRHGPRRVRDRGRRGPGRPARAQAHGHRRAPGSTRPGPSTSSATCRTSGWPGTTRRPTSACRFPRRTALRGRSGRRWRAAARW